MRTLVAALVLALCCALSGLAQDIRATTEDGRKVVLRSDGTWVFAQTAQASGTGVPPAATERFVSRKKFYSLSYNPAKWHAEKGDHGDAELFLEHESGEAYAMVIAERVEMTLDGLREMALANAKEAAPDLKVIADEIHEINGTKGRLLQLNGTVNGAPITYYGYYWTGKSGTLQVVTFTGQNLFTEFRSDMAEVLSGLLLTNP